MSNDTTPCFADNVLRNSLTETFARSAELTSGSPKNQNPEETEQAQFTSFRISPGVVRLLWAISYHRMARQGVRSAEKRGLRRKRKQSHICRTCSSRKSRRRTRPSPSFTSSGFPPTGRENPLWTATRPHTGIFPRSGISLSVRSTLTTCKPVWTIATKADEQKKT